MYSTIVEWTEDRFGLGSTYIDPVLGKYAGKQIFTFSFPVTLIFDIWTSIVLSQLPLFGDMSPRGLYAFPISSKSWTRTDRRTDRV